nr:bacteriophage Gp15 family protein [Alitiscatomonas aceti]
MSQYGLRIRTKEFETVTWDEFRSLLAGLSPETPLGRIVAIRSETDKNVIHNFTRDQKRIYDEWREREVETMTQETFEKQMASLELMMARLCG